MNRIFIQIGFWSSLLAAVTCFLFTACFIAIVMVNPLFIWTNLSDYLVYTQHNNQTFVYVAQTSMLCFGSLYLLMLNSIYEYAAPEKKILVRIALSLGAVFAALTGSHYFVQISAVRWQLNEGQLAGIEQFLQAKPDSVMAAVNMLGWTFFFGLSSLFVAPVFGGSRLAHAIKRLFFVNGIFCLIGGVAYVFKIVILVFVTINLGMGGAITTLTILLCFFFRGENVPDNQAIRGEAPHESKQWRIKAAIGIVIYGLILFLAAGSMKWVWGWVLLGVLTAVSFAPPLLLAATHPELITERKKGIFAKDVKRWDQWLTGLAGGMMFFTWIVAGLDLRFQWTRPLSIVYHLGGLLVVILGHALFLWAMSANAFFSQGVRIQAERGHTVATAGPYRYVRHPGYVGVLLAHLATPLLLGSLWALLPSVLLVMLFVVRTWLEDATLMAELPGYKAFGLQTRYRLLPGVW